MATHALESKFDRNRSLAAGADTVAASEVADQEGARRGLSHKAAQTALSEKVWVGAAPTGKKPPKAALKRKLSMAEAPMPKIKKAKGEPVVASRTLRSKAPVINMDASSSADQYEVLAKPKGKKSMVDVVLAPNLESDSTTESSSDNKPKTDNSVAELSEDEGLVGDHSSVMRQLQSERSAWTASVKGDEVSAKPKKISHREKVQLAEIPKFAPINIKAEAQEYPSSMNTPQAQFSKYTDLFEQAGKPLALLSQSKPVKDIIHETIDRTLEAIVFITGFPPAADRIKNGRLVVAAAAERFSYKEIEARCSMDTHYVDETAKVGKARIFSLQKMLKEKATTHDAAQYKLQRRCKALVTALLAGRSYIFPGDVMNPSMVQRNAPYGHPIFAALHAEVFFKTKLSLGNIHPHHFINLIEGGDPREREVPPAMLELVATVVHAALLEWADGYYQSSEFSYNRSLDIYDLHLQTLKSIFTYNIHGFHRTLSDLYRDATGRALIVPMEDCDVDFSAMRT